MNFRMRSGGHIEWTWVLLSLVGGALALGTERLAWHVGALGAGATFSIAQWLWLTGRGARWERWIFRSGLGVLFAWPVGFAVQQIANAYLVMLIDPSLVMTRVPDTPFFESNSVSTFVYVWLPMAIAGIAGGLILGCAQMARLDVSRGWRWVVLSGIAGAVVGPALGAILEWSMLSDVVLHGGSSPIPSMEHTGVPGVADVPSPLLTIGIGAFCGSVYGLLTGRVMASLLETDRSSNLQVEDRPV